MSRWCHISKDKTIRQNVQIIPTLGPVFPKRTGFEVFAIVPGRARRLYILYVAFSGECTKFYILPLVGNQVVLKGFFDDAWVHKFQKINVCEKKKESNHFLFETGFLEKDLHSSILHSTSMSSRALRFILHL